jgi:hypothetical protein
MSVDDITSGKNELIYGVFQRQCCPSIKFFIEGEIIQGRQKYYLFVNDEQTHYFLTDREIELANVRVNPLIRYRGNDVLFSITHNDVFYFFEVSNRGYYRSINNYKDDNSSITLVKSVPIADSFEINTSKGEKILCIYSDEKEVYAFKIIIENKVYEQVTAIEVREDNNGLVSITYDGYIYNFDTNFSFKPKQYKKKSPTPKKKSKKSPTSKKKSNKKSKKSKKKSSRKSPVQKKRQH